MYDKEKFSKSYYKEAKHWIELAEISFNKKRYNTVIRECQTAVELAIKSLFFKLGWVILKTHNLKEDLNDAKELLSKNFQNNYELIYKLSNRLYSQREDSLYGDVELNLTSDEIFEKEKVEIYLKETKKVLNIIEKELDI